MLTDQEREKLETKFLRALMKADAQEWRKRLYFDNGGLPDDLRALDPAVRMMRRVTKVGRNNNDD
jgi:hypothetical protein